MSSIVRHSPAMRAAIAVLLLTSLSLLSGLAPLTGSARASMADTAAWKPSAAEEVEPYSNEPAETAPYATCPPPNENKASCLAATVPTDHGEPVLLPAYEGSGEIGGLSPADLQSAYDFPNGGAGQVVAVVDAYDDPHAEADLAVYRERYGLPPCTTANGCFKKVNDEGEEGYPPPANQEWAVEISLDIDMVSAACPKCDILLVEAGNSYIWRLIRAEETAIMLGATAVSNSWAAEEGPESSFNDPSFEHPGTPILAASGDWGYGAYYPASSSSVIAVGGTTLQKAANPRGWSETAWSLSGSGCSEYEKKPAWQTDSGCSNRTVADVSAVADPATPLSVYDSYGQSGWMLVGGTSAATPIMAGYEAESSEAFRSAGAQALYEAGESQQLYDVVEGATDVCRNYLCEATIGYDGPTGWGTPGEYVPGPAAETLSVAGVGRHDATLRGRLNPEGSKTTYQFEYGPTTSYGSSIPATPVSIAASTREVQVEEKLSGLTLARTYHYRLVTTNDSGTHYGEDMSVSTSRWSVLTTASLESGINAVLRSVSCASNQVCLGVGNQMRTDKVGLSSFSEYWDGTSWSVKAVPEPGSESRLWDVSCASASMCMGVGFSFSFGSEVGTFRPDAVVWNGSSWSLTSMPLPSKAADARILSVSCPSPGFCMAVGEYREAAELGAERKTLTEYWDGTKWVLVSSPNQEGYDSAWLNAVSCTSATWCKAVGPSQLIEHWNGAAWSVDSVPSLKGGGGRIEGISCTSTTFCIGVGTVGNEYAEKAFTVRWNGSVWQIVTEGIPGTLKDVSCTASNWCETVGNDAYTGDIAERWDGTEWTDELPIRADAGYEYGLMGVACVLAKTCVTSGYHYPDPKHFLPVAQRLAVAPAVSSNAATSITTEGATLSGVVNPNELDTVYQVEYGSTGSYGQAIPVAAKDIGSGLGDVTVSQSVHGLAQNAAYHYRIAATNEEGTSYSPDRTFTTFTAPSAATDSATAIKGDRAVFNGVVNPNGTSTEYWFEYGPTGSYGSRAPAKAKVAGAGSSGVAAAIAAGGLTPNTSYHFRLVAKNAYATAYGVDKSFETSSGDVWLHNGLALGDEAVVNFDGSVGFESGEAGGIECSGVHAAVDLSPGDAPAAVDFELRNDGKGCKATGPLIETFECGLKSGTETGSVTASPDGETLTLANLYFTYQTTSSCLLGDEVLIECSGLQTTPDDMHAISELSLADDRDDCESNIGPMTTFGALEKEAPGDFAGSVAFDYEGAGVIECGVSMGLDLDAGNNGTISGFLNGDDECESIGLLHEFGCEVQSAESKAPITVAGHGPVLKISGMDVVFAMNPECEVGEELAVSCQPFTAEADDIALITGLQGVDEFSECENSVFGLLYPHWDVSGPATGTFGFGSLPADWTAEYPSPEFEHITSLFSDASCRAADDCVAVGIYESKASSALPFAAAWNGSDWSSQALPLPSGRTRAGAVGVACPTSQSCTAVGYAAKEAAGVAEPFASRWDGSKWVSQVPPVPAGEPSYAALTDVDCTYADFCVGVGLYVAKGTPVTDPHPYAVVWNGGKWSLLEAALPGGLSEGMLNSVDCSEHSFSCVAVGSTYDHHSFVERWSGTSNSAATVGSEELVGISCLSDSSCLASGVDGLWKLSGGEWTSLGAPYLSELEGSAKEEPGEGEEKEKPLHLGDLSCLSADECVVATADQGDLLRWHAGEWSRETGPGAGYFVNRVQCLAPAACLGVGLTTGESTQPAAARLNLPG
jgi:hypothetical protein